MIRGLRPLLIGLCIFAAPPARAIDFELGDNPWTLNITNSLFLDYHRTLYDGQREIQNVADLRDRLNVRVRSGGYTFGMRLDVSWWMTGSPGEFYRNDIRPEELFFTARWGKTIFTAGDDYLSVARGLSLSLRKIDEVGYSTNLRGLHLSWRNKVVRGRIGAGVTNVTNVDGVEEKIIPDPLDLVFNARTAFQITKGFKLGIHGVDVERRNSPVWQAIVAPMVGGAAGEDVAINNMKFIRSTVVGGSIELPRLLKVFDVYAEFNHLWDTNTRVTAGGEVDDGETGTALYATVTAFLDDWTVLAEFKRYDNYELESTLHPETNNKNVTQTFTYIAPPTLERIDQRIFNNSDVTGGRAHVSWAIPKTTSNLFLSASYFADAPVPGGWTSHTYGGWEMLGDGGDRLQIQVGYRHEATASSDLTALQMAHIDVDWSHRLTGTKMDLQFHLNHQFRSKDVGTSFQDDYLEGTTYITLNMAPHWSFTAQFEYLTEKGQDAPYFPGAFIQFRFGQGSLLRLFGGRSKGGLKCSGGVCRVFPDFDGVKLETILRF